MYLQLSAALPPIIFSFSTDCFAIKEALLSLLSFHSGNYLIVHDSQLSIMTISGNPSNFKYFYLVLNIRSLLWTLHSENFNIKFLWVPAHVSSDVWATSMRIIWLGQRLHRSYHQFFDIFMAGFWWKIIFRDADHLQSFRTHPWTF